jgi:hypothetical protein
MGDFGRCYEKWRAASFPSGSSDDVVDELHAQLAQWDAFAADAMVPFADGRGFEPGQLDISSGLAELRDRVDALAATADPENAKRLSEYLDYCDLLRSAYQAAEREASNVD